MIFCLKKSIFGGVFEFKKGDPPVIGVCLDGTGPNHLAGVKMPNFWSGSYRDAYAFLPTVTNTNNVSIITGVAPSVHGVVANTILESKKKRGEGNIGRNSAYPGKCSEMRVAFILCVPKRVPCVGCHCQEEAC